MHKRQLFRDVDPRLLKRWLAFDKANPCVYDRFLDLSFQVYKLGYRKYSAWTVLTAIRFQMDLTTKGEEFKINNDYVALYARKFIQQYPFMVDFFVLRQMKKRRKKSS
jgi:hypothetical protein